MKKKKRYSGKKFDFLLIVFLCVSLSIVIISQIGLRFSATRTFFGNTHMLSSESVGEENDVVEIGKITLAMPFGVGGNHLEIMVNGEKVDVFDLPKKEIELLSTSVIEIKASNIKEKTVVRIEALSDNMSLVSVGEEFELYDGINMIGRVMFNKN